MICECLNPKRRKLRSKKVYILGAEKLNKDEIINFVAPYILNSGNFDVYFDDEQMVLEHPDDFNNLTKKIKEYDICIFYNVPFIIDERSLRLRKRILRALGKAYRPYLIFKEGSANQAIDNQLFGYRHTIDILRLDTDGYSVFEEIKTALRACINHSRQDDVMDARHILKLFNCYEYGIKCDCEYLKALHILEKYCVPLKGDDFYNHLNDDSPVNFSEDEIVLYRQFIYYAKRISGISSLYIDNIYPHYYALFTRYLKYTESPDVRIIKSFVDLSLLLGERNEQYVKNLQNDYVKSSFSRLTPFEKVQVKVKIAMYYLNKGMRYTLDFIGNDELLSYKQKACDYLSEALRASGYIRDEYDRLVMEFYIIMKRNILYISLDKESIAFKFAYFKLIGLTKFMHENEINDENVKNLVYELASKVALDLINHKKRQYGLTILSLAGEVPPYYPSYKQYALSFKSLYNDVLKYDVLLTAARRDDDKTMIREFTRLKLYALIKCESKSYDCSIKDQISDCLATFKQLNEDFSPTKYEFYKNLYSNISNSIYDDYLDRLSNFDKAILTSEIAFIEEDFLTLDVEAAFEMSKKYILKVISKAEDEQSKIYYNLIYAYILARFAINRRLKGKQRVPYVKKAYKLVEEIGYENCKKYPDIYFETLNNILKVYNKENNKDKMLLNAMSLIEKILRSSPISFNVDFVFESHFDLTYALNTCLGALNSKTQTYLKKTMDDAYYISQIHQKSWYRIIQMSKAHLINGLFYVNLNDYKKAKHELAALRRLQKIRLHHYFNEFEIHDLDDQIEELQKEVLLLKERETLIASLLNKKNEK